MHSPSSLRKTLARYVYPLVLLTMAAFGTLLRGAPDPADPIVGDWVWHRNEMVTFRVDGTVHHSHGAEGTWEYLQNPEVQRHYRIIWQNGRNTDEVTCSEDGQSAHIRNQAARTHFDAHRTLPDKPAAVPTPARSASGPSSVTPAQTMAAVKPATDVADPVIGEWQWYKGSKVTFRADGTVTSSQGPQGTWEFLHNPEADREYRLDWTHGAYIDHLTYNPAARTGHIVNQKGAQFNVTQGAAVPGQAANYFGAPGR